MLKVVLFIKCQALWHKIWYFFFVEDPFKEFSRKTLPGFPACTTPEMSLGISASETLVTPKLWVKLSYVWLQQFVSKGFVRWVKQTYVNWLLLLFMLPCIWAWTSFEKKPTKYLISPEEQLRFIVEISQIYLKPQLKSLKDQSSLFNVMIQFSWVKDINLWGILK